MVQLSPKRENAIAHTQSRYCGLTLRKIDIQANQQTGPGPRLTHQNTSVGSLRPAGVPRTKGLAPLTEVRGPERGKSVSRDTLGPISGPQIRKTRASFAISADGADRRHEADSSLRPTTMYWLEILGTNVPG